MQFVERGLSRARAVADDGVGMRASTTNARDRAPSSAPASASSLAHGRDAGAQARRRRRRRRRPVDEIFSKWTSSTPGCAVGVAVGGKPVLLKAYGMADLEHDVRNTPDTIFEAGSVAKQFTAMAVQLLAGDGKLSLDDPVRKYIPELPDYGKPLTIRHMLTHTSGLRDWGSVASIAGWPRTTREYTHAHVLDIVSRQKSLNFDPGTKWSYSNTGFNLAAVIVSRVSGMSFAEFSKQRIFAPLGMTHTSWRDDHTRIVKGRAIAYSRDERRIPHRDAVRERARQRRPADDRRRSADRGTRTSSTRRSGNPKLIAEMSTGRHSSTTASRSNYGLGLFVERLPRRAQRLSQRIDRRIPRASQSLPRVAHVGRRALQRLERRRDAIGEPRVGRVPRRSLEAGAAGAGRRRAAGSTESAAVGGAA